MPRPVPGSTPIIRLPAKSGPRWRPAAPQPLRAFAAATAAAACARCGLCAAATTGTCVHTCLLSRRLYGRYLGSESSMKFGPQPSVVLKFAADRAATRACGRCLNHDNGIGTNSHVSSVEVAIPQGLVSAVRCRLATSLRLAVLLAQGELEWWRRRELVLLSHDVVVTCIQNFAADTNKKTRAGLGFLIGGGGGS